MDTRSKLARGAIPPGPTMASLFTLTRRSPEILPSIAFVSRIRALSEWLVWRACRGQKWGHNRLARPNARWRAAGRASNGGPGDLRLGLDLAV